MAAARGEAMMLEEPLMLWMQIWQHYVHGCLAAVAVDVIVATLSFDLQSTLYGAHPPLRACCSNSSW